MLKQISYMCAGVVLSVVMFSGVFDEAGGEEFNSKGWCSEICLEK